MLSVDIIEAWMNDNEKAGLNICDTVQLIIYTTFGFSSKCS